MAASRLFSAIASRFQAGPFVSEEPNLPSGGHSGYRPEEKEIRMRRTAARRATQPAPMGFQSTGPAAQFGQPGYTGYTASQPMAAQSSGAHMAYGNSGAQMAYQQSGSQVGYQFSGSQISYPPYAGQTGYQTGAQMSYQAPVQQAWQPAAVGGYPPPAQQMNYAQQGYPQAMAGAAQGGWAAQPQQPAYAAEPQEQAAYRQNFPQRENKPYENKFGQASTQPVEERSRRFGREEAEPQVQPQPQPLPDNVSYMPNVFVGNDGAAYRHVERLTQPMSAATCYRLIEFMRNGETVIVNTELIQDERENQRCLDLLYGAAYTMKCTFTRISAKSIYLIAPATVSVISYESIRQMNEQDAAVRWPGAEGASFGGSRPRHQPVFGGVRAAE